MGKVKEFIKSPKATAAAFALAMVLLLFSSVGGARAALTYYSENYTSRVQMENIGVTLVENGEAISNRDYKSASDGTWDENTGTLLGGMLAEGEEVKLGKRYREELDKGMEKAKSKTEGDGEHGRSAAVRRTDSRGD